jgi:hypothetical protein
VNRNFELYIYLRVPSPSVYHYKLQWPNSGVMLGFDCISKLHISFVVCTMCLFYFVPEDGSCHEMFWQMLDFLCDKSAMLREWQIDTLHFQIIYWGSLFENFIQTIKILLSGSFFQEWLHHQARIPHEGPWSWFWQNVCEYWLKIIQTSLLLLKVMWSDSVNLMLWLCISV